MSNRCSTVLDEVHHIILGLLRQIAAATRVDNLLDVGCGDGRRTVDYLQAAGSRQAFGVDVFPHVVEVASSRGIAAAVVDLERHPFPWPDQSMDVVVCNQVLEHLKNIWLPMSEIARVLRIGGHLLCSTPNLASLHNRILLALGLQPTSIRTFGPHVRGFTLGQLRAFLSAGGVFRLRRVAAAGFYPLPARLARPLAALFPGAAHTAILWVQKIAESSPWPWTMYARLPQETSWSDAPL